MRVIATSLSAGVKSYRSFKPGVAYRLPYNPVPKSVGAKATTCNIGQLVPHASSCNTEWCLLKITESEIGVGLPCIRRVQHVSGTDASLHDWARVTNNNSHLLGQ